MAGPTDPFANLAAARKGPQQAVAIPMPPAMAAKHRQTYKDVADGTLEQLKYLGDLMGDKASACSDLVDIYKSQKDILGNHVDMAKMGMGAGVKLGLLDEALKAGKVEETFKATGDALQKRCPTTNLE